mmetsp:Transcript_38738/g.92558  ORF Transcript_38738/g.92558 Transcript_38738/m.92558 type:complete len:201 (-) Transcript_38738:777-1379(-)
MPVQRRKWKTWKAMLLIASLRRSLWKMPRASARPILLRGPTVIRARGNPQLRVPCWCLTRTRRPAFSFCVQKRLPRGTTLRRFALVLWGGMVSSSARSRSRWRVSGMRAESWSGRFTDCLWRAWPRRALWVLSLAASRSGLKAGSRGIGWAAPSLPRCHLHHRRFWPGGRDSLQRSGAAPQQRLLCLRASRLLMRGMASS